MSVRATVVTLLLLTLPATGDAGGVCSALRPMSIVQVLPLTTSRPCSRCCIGEADRDALALRLLKLKINEIEKQQNA